jgi:hypothetical protein
MPAISSNRQSPGICRLIFLMPKRKRKKAILTFWPRLQQNALPIRPSTHYKPRFARPWPLAFLPIQKPERAQREVAAREAFRNWQSTGIRVNAVASEIEAFRLVAKGIASEAQFGQKTTLDLLDAEKDVNDAELSLVSAEHNQLLAAFRLKAAIGSLTAEQMGLGDVLGQLSDMPQTPSPFYDSLPFGRKPIND